MVQSDLAEGAKAGSFVAAPQGLFPAPLPPGRGGSRLLPRFTLLGRAAAKALQDGRMLDVPLSHTFYRCSPFLAAPWKAPLGGATAGLRGLCVCTVLDVQLSYPLLPVQCLDIPNRDAQQNQRLGLGPLAGDVSEWASFLLL